MFSVATLLTITGVGMLYATWRRRLPHVGALVGWFLVLAGGGVWSSVAGTDRGVALSLITLCMSGLAFLLVSAIRQLRSSRTASASAQATVLTATGRRRPKAIRPSAVGGISLPRRLGWFLLAGPVAGLLAFSTAILTHQLLVHWDVEPANALVTELFVFPVLWAVLVTWVFMATALRHTAVKLIALTFLNAGCLVMLDTPAMV